METQSRTLLNFPVDVLLLVLECLLSDTKVLCSLSLACKVFRDLSRPFLLRRVDLSSHNGDQMTQCEDEAHPNTNAHHSDDYRPPSLISRQRAFLRLMTNFPSLASHVQWLSWTLIWIEGDEKALNEIDFQLWTVFGHLINVQRLDLASLHQIVEERFVRQNPSRLFPAVTHLRLHGWMHRGLVDAIIKSLNPAALHTLNLDFLDDEGAFPNRAPMSHEIARGYARTISHTYWTLMDSRSPISEELYERQLTGRACIFPGPMWTPLRSLASQSCPSLTNFVLRISSFNGNCDIRNYYTCFNETARFLSTIKHPIKSLTVVFGLSSRLYAPLHPENLEAYFLNKLLPVLSTMEFPSLACLDFQGFDVLEDARDTSVLGEVPELRKKFPLPLWQTVTGKANAESHEMFNGYNYKPDTQTFDEFVLLLRQS